MYEQNENPWNDPQDSQKCTTAIPNREMHPTVWLSLP